MQCKLSISLTHVREFIGGSVLNHGTYFTVIQTKTYPFHVSTSPKSILDKKKKKRREIVDLSFLDVEKTFRHTFPPVEPGVLCA